MTLSTTPALVWGQLTPVGSKPAAADAASESLDIRLQLAWGGGATLRQWHGAVTVDGGELLDVTPLGFDADQSRTLIWESERLLIQQSRPRRYDGAVIHVRAPRDTKLRVQLAPVGENENGKTIELNLADFLEREVFEQLDDARNSLWINRLAGDGLRINFLRDSLVFSPGERWTFDVVPHEFVASHPSVKAQLKLVAQPSGKVVWSEEHNLRPDATGRLAPLTGLTVTLPEDQGVYVLQVGLSSRSWATAPFTAARPVLERSVQLVVVRSSPPSAVTASLNGSGESKVIAEFDPANPSWWERLPKLAPPASMRRWLPGSRETTLSSPGVATKDELGRRWVSLPVGGWQAFPLPLEHVGEPHEVTIEYPETDPQTVAVTWLDPNAAGELAPGNLDTGWVVQRTAGAGTETSPTGNIGTHRLIIWPRAEGGILLVVNRSSKLTGQFGTIRVRRLPQPLPASTPAMPQRQIMAYVDAPSLPTTFSGAEQLDGGKTSTFEDWGTFYDAGEHFTQYLQYVGYQGAAVLVAGDGSTLYPSQVWRATPRFDRGVFFSNGQDPVRKDVLELMLRQCSRQGLTLVPMIRFNATLVSLEALMRQNPQESQGIALVDGSGRPAVVNNGGVAGAAPHYNPLDPRVQAAMVEVVDELLSRYAHHQAFGGLMIDLAENGFTQMPNWDWGADPTTWQRFATSQPAGTVPPELEPRQALRQPAIRNAWLEWRSQQLTNLYRAIHDSVKMRRADIRLFLSPNHLVHSAPFRAALWPSLNQSNPANYASAFAMVGLDLPTLSRLPQLVVMRPRRYGPSFTVAQNAVNLQLNAAELDAFLERHCPSVVRSDLIVREVDRSTLKSFDKSSPYGPDKTYTVLETVFSQAGAEYRRPYTEALARRDVNWIFDGGTTVAMGQQDQMREWLATFHQLPVAKLDSVAGEGISADPVILRAASDGRRTVITLLNQSAWPVSTVLRLKVPFGTSLRSLGPQTVPELKFEGDSATWKSSLRPLELLSLVVTSPDVKVEQLLTTVTPDVVQRLREQISVVAKHVDQLSQPQPLTLLSNAGFEAIDPNQPLPGWTASNDSSGGVTVRKDAAPEGQQYGVMERRQEGRTWLVSEPFAAPATGRLYVSARIRTSQPNQQPRLQFGIEGKHDGRTFNRADVLGTEPGKLLTDEWREFVFPVEDLPTQGTVQLRVTFDLWSPGTVEIDDIRLFDLYLTKDDRKFIQFQILAIASLLTKELKYHACAQLLESYWPQMLAQYPVNGLPVLVDRKAEPAAPPAEKTRPTAKDGSGISEALRNLRPRPIRR